MLYYLQRSKRGCLLAEPIVYIAYPAAALVCPERPPAALAADRRPYHVWLSEIMLQQTRVEAVWNYYLRFLAALPTVEDLAAAEEDKLLKLWEGLGYYNRARNLQKCARVIVNDLHGEFPTDYDGWLALPGIGPYTAGAVASICFVARWRR